MEEEENIWKRKIFARQRKRRIEEEIIWSKKYLNCGGQEERRRKKKKIFEGDWMTGYPKTAITTKAPGVLKKVQRKKQGQDWR